MSSTKEQVKEFIKSCEEIKSCKFIMATTKIKDLLKCIVNNLDLYRLIDEVTRDFDYIECKSKCLLQANDFSGRSQVILPQNLGQRLAFIFCLLVEFDRDTLNFNDFLQNFFYEDGSYVTSYKAFCALIISDLENIIIHIFKDVLDDEPTPTPAVPQSNGEKANLISALELAIEEEKQYVREHVSSDDADGGEKLLDGLVVAIKEGKEDLIDALVCGYNYFVLYSHCVSDGISSLLEMIVEYEKML